MLAVNPQGDVGVAAVSENRRGSGVGIDPVEIRAGEFERAFRFIEFVNVVQIKGAARSFKCSLRAAEDEGAEFETRIDIGKIAAAGIAGVLAVFKIVQRAQTPATGNAAEKRRRALVGGNAGRREQSNQPGRADQALRPLDKQAVEIDIAAAQQGIVTAFSQYPRIGFSAFHGGLVFLPERGAFLLQGGNARFTVGGARCSGNLQTALGKPFDFLEFDAVPGRIANHKVKAAATGIAGKHVGEKGLPVKEVFAFGKRFRASEQGVGGGYVFAFAIDFSF